MRKDPLLSEDGKEARKPILRVWDVLYYAMLAVLVLGVVLLRSVSGSVPLNVASFSAMQVVTGSMGEELPQGCLVITRRVDPEALEVGDDITFFSGGENTVTHRIVEVQENYKGTGQRAFATQGVSNAQRDSRMVVPDNIVGRVIFHSLPLGLALGFVRDHWPWLLVLTVLFLALAKTLHVFFTADKKKEP